MIGNLSGRQILLIILAIVVVIWLINWIFSSTTIKTQVVRPIEIQNPNPTLGSTLNPALGSARNSALAQATQPVSLPAQSKNIPVNETDLPSKAPFTLYYFYSPTCPACQKFSPVWNDVADKLKGIDGISVEAIDATKSENENLAFYYNIQKYPTVILVTPDKNIEYSGNRTSSDLYRFVVSNIASYAKPRLHANLSPSAPY